MKLRRYLLLVLGALGMVLLNSCYDAKDVYILNPDGSGKVKHEAVFALDSFSMGDKKLSAEEMLHDAVQKVLDDSEGVDAWTDVSYELLDGKKAKFSGVAYFDDINALEIKIGGSSSTDNRPYYEKNGDTDGVVRFYEEKEKSSENMALTKVSDLDSYKKIRPMMESFMSTMTHEIRVKLPGEYISGSNVGSKGAPVANLVFKGSEMLETMDALMEDESFLKKLKNGESFEELTNGIFLKGAETTFKINKRPQFDYKKEVVTAQKSYDAWLKKQPFTVVETISAVSSGVGEPKLVGLRVVKDIEYPQSTRPFHTSKNGVSVSLLITPLGGKVIDTDGGKITKFVTNTGESIKNNDSFGSNINNIRLSDDGSAVNFDLVGNSAGKQLTGFSEISGYISVVRDSATETKELVFSEFAKGETADGLGAVIKEIEKNKYNADEVTMKLSLDLKASQVKEMLVYDSDGKKLKAKQRGYSSMNGVTEFNLNCRGEYPKAGKIEVIYYAEQDKAKIPFSLKDILIEDLFR